MNKNQPNKVELVYASDYEEFFYKDTGMSVSNGQPVGVDVDEGVSVHFVLFDDIYWSPNYEPQRVK